MSSTISRFFTRIKPEALRDPLHFEAGGESLAVVALAQGVPAHRVAIDGDFPPLSVLLAALYPAGAKQVSGHEVYAGDVPDYSLEDCWLQVPEITKDVDTFYYNNIKDNAAKRIAAYKTNR